MFKNVAKDPSTEFEARREGSQMLSPRRLSGFESAVIHRFLLTFISRVWVPIILSAVAALSGCGTSLSRPATGLLVVSPQSVSFGNVGVGQTGTMTVALENLGLAPITINQLSTDTQAFSVTGQSDLPIHVAVGGSYTATVHFNPTASGTATGNFLVTTPSAGSTVTASLSGTGIPVLNSLSCTTNSVQGQGSDTCSVGLNAVALGGGFVVNLSTNSTALSLPQAVTVPQASTSLSFPVSVTGVSASQSATLIASANGASEQLELNLIAPSGAPHTVQLSWMEPNSPNDPIIGYNIFRAPIGSSVYQLLNSQIDLETTYLDTTAQSGINYYYYVVSVDASGASSTPSNTASLGIP